MERMDLKVGYSCNNRCIHCTVENNRTNALKHHKKDLSYDQCIAIIKDGLRRNVKEIVITGGEPTIRQDINELLTFCLKNDLFVYLQTNGRMLSQKALTIPTQYKKNLQIIIALHSCKPDKHDQVTGCLNTFIETVAGITNLLKCNFRVVGKVIITQLNISELRELVSFMAQIGIKRINMAFPNINGGVENLFDLLVPRYKHLKPLLPELIALAEENGFYMDFESIPFCLIPQTPWLVGDIQYFNNLSRSVVHLDSEVFDWNKKRCENKSKFAQCASCFYEYMCEGIWKKYVKVFGDKEFKPIESVSPNIYSRLVAHFNDSKQMNARV